MDERRVTKEEYLLHELKRLRKFGMDARLPFDFWKHLRMYLLAREIDLSKIDDEALYNEIECCYELYLAYQQMAPDSMLECVERIKAKMNLEES